jgi:hypothetical protein
LCVKNLMMTGFKALKMKWQGLLLLLRLYSTGIHRLYLLLTKLRLGF